MSGRRTAGLSPGRKLALSPAALAAILKALPCLPPAWLPRRASPPQVGWGGTCRPLEASVPAGCRGRVGRRGGEQSPQDW
jgi:hypothetical protein